jgi:hypothetical protein
MAKKIEVLTAKDLRDLAVVGGGQDILDWKLYDTLNIPAVGSTQVQFKYFQQAVGPNGITLEQTNMDIPAQLANGVRFACNEIQVQPIIGVGMGAADLTDLYKATHSGILSFNIGTRTYFQVPILDCMGGGFYGFTGLPTIVYASNRNVHRGSLEYSPVIPSTFNFNVTLDYPLAPAPVLPVKVRVLLKGKLIRPRQG